MGIIKMPTAGGLSPSIWSVIAHKMEILRREKEFWWISETAGDVRHQMLTT